MALVIFKLAKQPACAQGLFIERTKERLSICIEYSGSKSHLLKANLNIHETNYLAANRSLLLVTDIFHFGTHSLPEIWLVFSFSLNERQPHQVTFLSLSLSLYQTHTNTGWLPRWLVERRLWEGGQIVCLYLCQGSAVGMRPWEQLLSAWLLADGSIRLEQQGAWCWMRLNASKCAWALCMRLRRCGVILPGINSDALYVHSERLKEKVKYYQIHHAAKEIKTPQKKKIHCYYKFYKITFKNCTYSLSRKVEHLKTKYHEDIHKACLCKILMQAFVS